MWLHSNNLKYVVISHDFSSKCLTYWPNQTWKQLHSENKHRFHVKCGIDDKFCITCRKLIMTTELQYFLNLRTNFNPDKFENLSTQFERQSIINIQLFFSVMGWKRSSNHFQSPECFVYVEIWFFFFFRLNDKVDFCLVNVKFWVSKWSAMYPVNFISRNK